jgi:aspartyl-tRNA(Asn)/glutamyl-tRNA(Gln) amidotransferase subunit A
LLNATLLELAGALEAKKVSSVELTRAFLARIQRLNGELNAFITVDPERSLADARRADERRARGEKGALLGIPVGFKDIYCTKGQRTTCGSRMLAEFKSPYDAHVVERFDAAGVVSLGKCNMDEFAMGSSNESSHFGPVKNPWDKRRVPGGSSGGSAAAVAARMAPGALGTDTGGSTRQPAAFSGVCGLRPTYGLVSRYGLVAFASSLDQAGPIARTAADLAVLLDGMAGFDERDSTSVQREKEKYALQIDLKGLRIGLPREYFTDGLQAEVRAAVDAAVAWFKSQGAKIIELELPHTKVGVAAYYVIAPAEASSNLSRRRSLRSPREGIQRPRRHVLPHPRRGFRGRSEAPHPCRHLCPLARLLRRVLPTRAEDPAPYRAGLHPRLREM